MVEISLDSKITREQRILSLRKCVLQDTGTERWLIKLMGINPRATMEKHASLGNIIVLYNVRYCNNNDAVLGNSN